MNKLLFLGTRAVYNGGNSKNITIPKAVFKELEKEGIKENDVKEAEVYYDITQNKLIFDFNVIVSEQNQK